MSSLRGMLACLSEQTWCQARGTASRTGHGPISRMEVTV